MDHRRQIQEFLASRRARISPQSVGLPVVGRKRRVPGLRREEVAALAGLSVDYYIRLERGALTNASDSVLQAIARALQLDAAEQAHLTDLARAGQPSAAPRSRCTPPTAIAESPRASRSGREGKRHAAALLCLTRRRFDVLHAMLRTGSLYQPPRALTLVASLDEVEPRECTTAPPAPVRKQSDSLRPKSVLSAG
jgi:transcriptional regulator with XRE-family HTH domain